ncbi:MAG: WecB/TagA/CpsF family glycosyltransferase [Pseudomonadota bacterium]
MVEFVDREGERGVTHSLRTFSAGNLRVNTPTFADSVELFFDLLDRGETGYLAFLAAHSVTWSRRDPEFSHILNNAIMALPDGAPLRWLGRISGHRNIERVTGPEFFEAVIKDPRSAARRHFFYGTTDENLKTLRERVASHVGREAIAGCYSPPIRGVGEKESQEVIRAIDDSRPDIVWVGLSTPKQEYWLFHHLQQFNRPTIGVGIGAAFDFFTGRVRRAPALLQRTGLEWLFRVSQEPRRLAPRYLQAAPILLDMLVSAFWSTRVIRRAPSASEPRNYLKP